VDIVVSGLVIVMGIAIAVIWTRDIFLGEHVDLSAGPFGARNPDGGDLYWPHWLAEYGTAALLVAGGVGLLADAAWAPVVAAVGAGALLYTSLNSLAWALARDERRAYAAPMLVGLAIGVLVTVYLLLR